MNLSLKKSKLKNKDVDIVSDDLLPGEEQEVSSKVEEPINKVEPFSDSIVSSTLKGVTVMHCVGSAEVSLFSSILDYYYNRNNSFIGDIFIKTSFMKKKGGRLL